MNFNLTKQSLKLIKKINDSVYGKVPKSHSVYRDRLVTYAFDLHDNLIIANVNKGTKRISYQKLALAKAYQIDMLMGLLSESNLVDKKAFMGTVSILSDLIKMLIGWIKSEEN